MYLDKGVSLVYHTMDFESGICSSVTKVNAGVPSQHYIDSMGAYFNIIHLPWPK